MREHLPWASPVVPGEGLCVWCPLAPDAPLRADDEAIARDLLDRAHVAVVPGSVFGTPGALRLSFTEPPSALREGVLRMARWAQGRRDPHR